MVVDICGMAPLIQVFDMPRSIRFYRDVLEFRVVETAGPDGDCGWALLERDGVELMLNTAYEADGRPAEEDPARRAAHGDTCFYFGCRGIDDAYETLRGRGASPQPPAVASYGMRQMYVQDPDGYMLCFQWPASEEMREQWRERYAAG